MGKSLGRELVADVTKDERFAEFLQRLAAHRPAASIEAALELLSDTLNQVENELTDIPYAPENWETDGRMYPPQDDAARIVAGRSDVVRFRNKAHSTYVRDNGAIEIRRNDGAVMVSRPGVDGRFVDLDDDRSH